MYGHSGNPAPQNFDLNVNNDGYQFPEGNGAAYSAYVSDHTLNLRNYAFFVLIPAALPLFMSAITGLGFMGWWRNKIAAA